MAFFWYEKCVSRLVSCEKRLTLSRRFYALGSLFHSHGNENDAIRVEFNKISNVLV